MLDNSTSQAMLQQFEPLVFRVLNHYHVYKTDRDYEDFAQELRIKLCRIAEDFDGQPLTDAEDRYRFVTYASNGLRWQLLNLLKKRRNEQLLDKEKIDLVIDHKDPYQDSEAQVVLTGIHAKARQLLNDEEFGLYMDLVKGYLSVPELLDVHDLKRSTFYEMKKRIAAKLAVLKYQLQNILD